MADEQRVSDQLVRLVQVFFALVLAQGLLLYRSPLLDPFSYANRIAALACASVFYTTVASWVDWHILMVQRPYDTRQDTERFRVYADVGVTILYAYLLFTIEPLVGHPDASLARHLLGYALVFAAYIASGLLRRWTHGKGASKQTSLWIGFGVYCAVVLAYVRVRTAVSPASYAWLNAATLVVAFALMGCYRAYRRHLRRADERAAGRLLIGIDVDGVLADQIVGVLPLIEKRHRVRLSYADVTHWRLPIADTDIANEIEQAQQDRDYVLKMPVHEGAKRVLKFLHRTHRIVIITARKGEAAAQWTREWLNRNGLPFDELASGTEARKSEHRTDVLIDDYLGNVEEFLTKTNGVAVVVDQPWNRERTDLAHLREFGRLFVVPDLLALRRRWPEIARAALAAKKEGTIAAEAGAM